MTEDWHWLEGLLNTVFLFEATIEQELVVDLDLVLNNPKKWSAFDPELVGLLWQWEVQQKARSWSQVITWKCGLP